ncbi:dipeptidyl aminopeptidase/acylaminoacyl peptidase [Actinoalloteichus hoggarensis]|uniref:Prolyl tripeptidyl peptidase n=1 Tax=Actinoalloteichus hoggarensis TaxID=1470176 RepID=A0A221W8E5_9PSEU|nr:prolyl oligopeptidase family serine peptidase [Actinoalloteichus hoggarensis]ASO21983.1 Prolyl tripeptidyl peptidase precursor [Actinoalloteichus hoggarensis]MBB5923937.1 dipeptidyl aminopeptidase/acylaminoacyl peptidase [Actinoalloteichus hoggarensis]
MITDSDPDERPDTPFADLDAYLELPRLAGLRLAPDGGRLVVGAATLNDARTRHVSAVWEIDPTGTRQARRLTRSMRGESPVGFTAAGELLFLSTRPAPDADEPAAEAALWLQPHDGDAHVVAAPPGGVRDLVATASGTVLFGSSVMPSAADLIEDERIRTVREDAAVSAILHEEFPIRHWDHHLGPDRTRLIVADARESHTADDGSWPLRDLTGHVGRALSEDAQWDVTPDGRTVVTAWAVAEPRASQRHTLVAIDVDTGERRTLVDDADHEYEAPLISPDGTTVAVLVRRRATPEQPYDYAYGVLPVAGGDLRLLGADWDRWPRSARWTPDGAALIVVADDDGRAPLWRLDVATGTPARLTADGAYTDIQVSPDGQWVYALRSTVDSPPTVVRVPLSGGRPAEPLPGPAEALNRPAPLPGTLTEVVTTAADGTRLRAWLSLPAGASEAAPAPLLLWIHGGPVLSSNAWSWRWNPWIAVARGYAVLQPDPALSTGYGRDFIRRGWREWGDAPYTDLMAVTDAVVRRSDVDADRTAAMGGSFGGYLANWVAGHTNRFAAIVTHASDWKLADANEVGDLAHEFLREMTPETAEANSPHRFVDAITTPMLVIHGDKDYRVAVGESLRLFRDLLVRSTSGDTPNPHKFLYFPDENHWILTPNHTKAWYATVFAFLDQHVRGREWVRPTLLG